MTDAPAHSRYEAIAAALAGERLPCAFVLLDAFDRNVDRCLTQLGAKTLRLATKSVRAPELIRRILFRAGDRARGLLCMNVREAEGLAKLGLDDLLIAYPTAHPLDVEALAGLAASGKNVAIVVDAAEHLDALGAAATAQGAEVDVVIELDVSWRPLGRALHVGVRRSPIRSAAQAVALAERIAATKGVRLTGLMAYEAHVAGLSDRKLLHRIVKRFARPRVAALRAEVVAALRDRGFELSVVNGAGTGSIPTAAQEDCLTEVTAGSAFFCPTLFDHYRGLDYEPAAGFALPAARRSDPGLVTCYGGGFVASGEAGGDRLPSPWLPEGLRLTALEGAGEVQTPLAGPGAAGIALGAPVLFRHAKAGELCEQFKEVVLIENDRVVDRADTYRGLGWW